MNRPRSKRSSQDQVDYQELEYVCHSRQGKADIKHSWVRSMRLEGDMEERMTEDVETPHRPEKRKYRRRFGIECRLIMPRYDLHGNIVESGGGWWSKHWYILERDRDNALEAYQKNMPSFLNGKAEYEYRKCER